MAERDLHLPRRACRLRTLGVAAGALFFLELPAAAESQS